MDGYLKWDKRVREMEIHRRRLYWFPRIAAFLNLMLSLLCILLGVISLHEDRSRPMFVIAGATFAVAMMFVGLARLSRK